VEHECKKGAHTLIRVPYHHVVVQR
jgi:hypothetical protein